MQFLRRGFTIVTLAAWGALGFAGAALADQPSPWEIGMQAAGSPVEQRIESLHTLIQVIITVITLFVAGLLLFVLWRFSAKRHPTPSRTSHNTFLEVAWTLIPVLILVVIAIPSFRLIYYEDRTANADMTIKVTGHQWFWEYTYTDNGNLDFASYIVPGAKLKRGQPRLLTVDNQLVVPVGKNIRVLTTSADVIHSFFIPSLGVQRYAIPGRTIETWFRVTKPGVYYGECNQICGTNHSRMPISVRAVTVAGYQAWLAKAKVKFAANDAPSSVKVAAQAASPLVRVAAQAAPADLAPPVRVAMVQGQ